tara:strand:+ start:2964 stop:5156 length:2193 start_codon:yes stop_codon:yes gene_type:complete
MKTLFSSFSLILIFLFFTAVAYLSTAGLETSKFNNLIEKEIQKKNPKIQLELKKIKIKLDIKKIQLFLSTNNPKVIYQNIKIPVTKIKVYTKISKILNSKIELTQIVFGIKEFKIQDVQKIATRIKPSNFKTYLLNNLNGGEIEKALFNLSIDKNFKLNDYKASGSIKKLNSKISNNVVIKNISFNFIIDNNLTLINSINASYNGFSISNGSLDLQQKKEIEITGKLNTQFDMSKKQLNKFFTNFNFFKENKIDIQGFLLHDFYLKIGKNYKIIDYNYESSGNISQSKVTLKKKFQNRFIKKPIEKIFLEKIKLEIAYNKKNKKKLLLLNGFYSLDKLNYKKFKIKHNLNNKNPNYLIDMNLVENIFFDEINFQSDSSKKNNIKVDYSVKNKKHFFKSINFSEDKNLISIKGLLLNNKNEIEKLSSVKILTFKNNKENNNFVIKFRKKISIIGETYDSSNLINLLSGPTNSNPLKNFSKEVEVQIKNLITKSQIPLYNFNLIGLIEKGKFNKISAKSEFSKEKFLDISLKKNIDNKKLLEVYSDSPKAILGNYKFFEGIKGGKLLYNSAIGETNSISKLTIENFKVIKAPAFATLLTLADLGGVADLLSGKGMSFDILEIKFKEDPELTVIQEILALGSSVSLHMNGYLEKKTGLVSLSGTLVPAKTLNRLVSKIPLVGNILVGDKVGEGVFGVSFKIKGLPGKVKTTVNPVKSITPRFITRALEKMKTK